MSLLPSAITVRYRGRIGRNPLPAYLRFDGATLPHKVGTNGPGGTRISEGSEGHLCFGPYISLDAGNYVAGLYMRLLPGSLRSRIDLDVLVDGEHRLAQKSILTQSLFEDGPTLVSMSFTVEDRADSTEVRVYVHDGVWIEINELVVFSTRQRNWSGK